MTSNDWKEVSLEEVILFNPRESIKKGTIAKKVGMDKLAQFQRKIVGYEHAEFKSGTKFRNGDTLLARITPCLENGKTAQVDILEDNEVGFGSTEFIVLREMPNKSVNDFIYYLSISDNFRDIAIKSMTGTSGRQRAQKDVLEKTKILIPPLDEQRAIANILSTLDKKIETNNQINEKLEGIAQALFKHWFVDFEFPNENGNPYKSSGGEMIESELGMLPSGWTVGTLDCLTNISNKSIKPQEYPRQVFEHYSIPAYDNNKNPEYQRGIEIKSNKYVINKNVILVSKLNPSTKRIWKPTPQTENAICSTEFIVYQAKKQDVLSYVFEHLNNEIFQGILVANATGSTGSRQRVKPKETLKYKVILPPLKIQQQFSKVISPLHLQISRNTIENKQLSNLRDVLLPKLMSGEIRVPLKDEDQEK